MLGPAGRKLLSKQVHARFGHQGHHPDCRICNSVKKTTRRIPKDPDPIKAMPVGFGFGMDAFTFSVPNITGEKQAKSLLSATGRPSKIQTTGCARQRATVEPCTAVQLYRTRTGISASTGHLSSISILQAFAWAGIVGSVCIPTQTPRSILGGLAAAAIKHLNVFARPASSGIGCCDLLSC
eukprot:COSAG01_NODE_2507_length_7552_cov_56.408560_10_plen_181_part_00